jgi:hypothetical protein
LLALWQGNGYWEYSDGVYSLSARQVLHGLVPYHDFAAAQPPLLFYLGAGALAIFDEPVSIRIAMALFDAATSLMTLIAVRRLTGRGSLAWASAMVVLVTPWTLREHAQLLPETVGAPVVLGVALLASRGDRARWAGLLGAVAVGLKVALILPVVGAVALGRRRGRSVLWLVGAVAIGVLASLALFGTDIWTNVVTAQRQTGMSSLHYVAGLWAQAAWNLLPLAVPALLIWVSRDQIRDPALARTLLGATGGGILLLATLFKHGSSLTVVIVVEAPLVCLAACGVAALLNARRTTLWPKAAAAGALALGALQVLSLLAAPDDPKLFTRPLASSGPERVLSPAEVDSAAAAIRSCPSGTTTAAPPFLALHAGRQIAGSQPDRFIIAEAPALDRFLQRSARARVCTDGAPAP